MSPTTAILGVVGLIIAGVAAAQMTDGAWTWVVVGLSWVAVGAWSALDDALAIWRDRPTHVSIHARAERDGGDGP